MAPQDTVVDVENREASYKNTRHNGGRKSKGRGVFDHEMDDRYEGEAGVFQRLSTETGNGPARSIEGWIIVVTGLHEEITEEDVYSAFEQFGAIKTINIHIDRRTGFVLGFAFIEYESFAEAKRALDGMNGAVILDRIIHTDWAFCKGPLTENRR